MKILRIIFGRHDTRADDLVTVLVDVGDIIVAVVVEVVLVVGVVVVVRVVVVVGVVVVVVVVVSAGVVEVVNGIGSTGSL